MNAQPPAAGAAVFGSDSRHAAAPPARRLLSAALLLGAAIGLAAGFSGLYFGTLSVFVRPFGDEFHWSRAQIALLSSASMIGYALASPLLGVLIDKIGAVRVIAVSGILFAATMLLRSYLPGSYPTFLIVSLGIGLLGAGTAPPGYLAVLPGAFDRWLGLALSFSMVGAGLGSAVLVILAQQFITRFGWRFANVGLASIALAGGLVAAGLLRAAAAPRQALPQPRPTAQGISLHEALHTRQFWTLTVIVFIATCGGLAATVHIAALFVDHGMTPARAAQVGAYSGVGLMLGRFLAGMLLDVVHAPVVAMCGFLLGAIGLTTISLDPTGTFPLMAGSSLLFGFALGAEGDFAAFAVRRYFGTASFGAIYGVVIASYALGGVIGPVALGWVYDRFGTYEPGLRGAAVAYVLAGIAVLTLGPYRWAARS